MFGVTESLSGFWIPKMHRFDDELMVVEMDMMHQPPFIIDFAKVRLNSSPDFSEETAADNQRQGMDLFGDNWPTVVSLMADPGEHVDLLPRPEAAKHCVPAEPRLARWSAFWP